MKENDTREIEINYEFREKWDYLQLVEVQIQRDPLPHISIYNRLNQDNSLRSLCTAPKLKGRSLTLQSQQLRECRLGRGRGWG